MLQTIAEVDEQALWRDDGATSMTPWLAGRYGIAWGTAREWVRVARALRRLPAIREAHASGSLSFDQLKPLTRFATEETDKGWARKAPVMSPRQLWTEARRRERLSRRQAEDDARLRYLRMGWDEERRFLYLEGQLPAEQGARIESALTRRAEQIILEEGPLSDRHGARLADALTELVSSSEGNGSDCMVVHTDVAVLASAAENTHPALAETESGVRLADETVRRLACDATIEWVVQAGKHPIGIGRRSRSVPPWLARLLRHRDRGCRFPGCERRRWLKAHHLWHWGDGGPTDLDNLVLLCHAHHRLVHEGSWTISGHPGTSLRFHDPGGRAPPQRASAGRADAA